MNTVVKYRGQPRRTLVIKRDVPASPVLQRAEPVLRAEVREREARLNPKPLQLAKPRDPMFEQLERERQRQEFARKKKPKAVRGIGDGPRKKEFKLGNLSHDDGNNPEAEQQRVDEIVRATRRHGRSFLMTEISVTERKLNTLRKALEVVDDSPGNSLADTE